MNRQPTPKAKPTPPAAPFTAADLPIDDQGRIYHLQLKPGQIAPDILLVGDPGRAEFIGSTFLRDVEVEHEHRGLVTVTGTSAISGERATIIAPVKTTVVTSGMGTPSLEIVVNELVALNEIDFETRTRKPDFPRLHILRLGTSGALQASTPLGELIITTYAIGLDNSGLFYEAPYPDEHCRRLENEVDQLLCSAMSPGSRFYGRVHPYVSRAEPVMVSALLETARELEAPARLGLTVSGSGFFAPQGRDISRLRPSVHRLNQALAAYRTGIDGQRIENMEMEASFLLHFMGGLGHWAGVICSTIANRQENTFDPNYQQVMERAIRVALQTLSTLRSRYPTA